MISNYSLICSKINKQVTISIDIKKTPTFETPNTYSLGLIRECSAAEKICENCDCYHILQKYLSEN